MKETTTRTFNLSKEDVRKALIQFLLDETGLVVDQARQRVEVDV